MANALETLIDRNECPEYIDLETYISPNFMGLFVEDKHSEWLKSLAVQYCKKLSNLGITVEPHTKAPLHLSLAYQFSSTHFQHLRSMVEKLGSNTAVNWELRLYSRDSRLRNMHVHTVLHTHIPRQHDELELRPGDYIYLPEGACNASIDGWVEGISWLTGTSGYLPLNHTKRSADSDSWTLHASVAIIDNRIEMVEQEMPKSRRPPILSSTESLDTPDGIAPDNEPVNVIFVLRFFSLEVSELYHVVLYRKKLYMFYSNFPVLGLAPLFTLLFNEGTILLLF